MMIKYATKGKNDNVEQHLKIINFNHNFNKIKYAEKRKEKIKTGAL